MKEITKNKRSTSRKSLKNGTTGTTGFTNGSLSAEDVCCIIKTARESGVTAFAWKELTIQFERKEDADTAPMAGAVSVLGSSLKSPKAEISEIAEQARLAELLLSDPEEYERLIEKEAYLDGENDKRAQSVLRGSQELR